MTEIRLLKQFTLIIIGLLNLSSLALFYIDKKRAQFNQKRIPEKSLLLSAILAGGIGAIIGMFAFRHKTKHLKFKMMISISAIFTTVIIYLILIA